MSYKPFQIKGLALNQEIKQRHLVNYLANPSICNFCKQAILPELDQKICEVKNRKYCNHKCCYQHRVILGTRPKPKSKSLGKPNKPCHMCEQPVHNNQRKFCLVCIDARKEILPLNHREIRNHAATITKKRPRICEICGYSKFVEAAHIKAVSSFDESALLKEINDPSNFAMLCPNCHWEFDHNMTKLPDKTIDKDTDL